MYRQCWKLYPDGHIEEIYTTVQRQIEAECRQQPTLIPRWLTENPTPADFVAWSGSIPYRNVEYLNDEQYEWIDETVIIQILEGEKSIERGSYKKPPGGYAGKRTLS